MSFTSFTQSYRSYTSSVDTEPSAQNLSIMDSHVSPHEMISKLEGSDDLNEWEHDKFVLLSEILERFRPDDDVAEEWVVTFIEDGGVETLVNQLLNLALRYNLADMTIFASLVPLSMCLRSLSSYPSFLQYFLENDSDDVRETLANILKSGSMMCRREVVLLLTNLMLEESSSMEFVKCTYDLVSEVKGFTFFPLMRDFETQTTDSDYITDIFAFINAYILCESTFDSRMKAREEFTSFGLLDIIQNQEFKDLLSSSDTQSATALKIQLDFFTQQMADDETMALQPVHEVITQLSNTEVFSQTKVILQNLLEIYECHHDDFDDNLVQRIFDMLQKLLMDLTVTDDPETILRRYESAPLEHNSTEPLKVNLNSLANVSLASKMENFRNNKRVNLPPVHEKNRGNSYPIDKRCFSKTCLHDRNLSLPTSLRCTISDVDYVTKIRHWSHSELDNKRKLLSETNEHDTSFVTDGSAGHDSTDTESTVEKIIALSPHDGPAVSTDYERVLQAMDRMAPQNNAIGPNPRYEIASSEWTPISSPSEESIADGACNIKDSRKQKELTDIEPSTNFGTPLELESCELRKSPVEVLSPRATPTEEARPILQRSPSIKEFPENHFPALIERETVAFFHPQIQPTSCSVSMAALDTFVENKACRVEVTQRSYGSAGICCNGRVLSYNDAVEEKHSGEPSSDESGTVLPPSSVLMLNNCWTQTDHSDDQFVEKGCQTVPYLPPRGSKFPDHQLSFKDSSRSDIAAKRKEFSHIFYRSLRSPSSLRFKVPTFFQELKNMNSPFTSTPSGSPSMRRNGDKESVIVSQKLKEMTKFTPEEPRNKMASNVSDIKNTSSRGEVLVPGTNQKHLPLPYLKPRDQGTLKVYQTFTPTDVDTSYGPLVEEKGGYWIKNTRSVYPENTPSTPGASSMFDEINFRYADCNTNKNSLSPNYSPRINDRGAFDRRRPHKQTIHESNCAYPTQRGMFASRDSAHVNNERPPSLVLSRGDRVNVYQRQYHQSPVLTKAVNDCFYLIRNTEKSSLMNVNHSRHNHNNLQSKVNLKVSDFSANSYSNLNTHKLARVNEHLLGLSGSCSVSGKIIAPIKSYPLWSREEVKLDDAMLITSSTTTEGKPQKKKGAKGMLNKMKKTLRKSTGGGSKSNLETSHNLQQPHSAEQPPPAASSNTSGSVAPSSELSRSSYVPSDDDKISIHYASLGRNNRKVRHSYNNSLPHHASQPISNAYVTDSPMSRQNSSGKKKKANKLFSKRRRSSFSKLKTLFTARPEAESSSSLYGRTGKSKSTKDIHDLSTMSQPFYNPGIDDLTIVKENDSIGWNAVNDEQLTEVFVSDVTDNHIAVPSSHQPHHSLKMRSTHGDSGTFQGLKELPETDL